MARKSAEQIRREAQEIQTESRSSSNKDPSRVAGGKKAAATRKERYGSARPGASKKSEED